MQCLCHAIMALSRNSLISLINKINAIALLSYHICITINKHSKTQNKGIRNFHAKNAVDNK